MNVAGRIWRPVMQHEERSAFAGGEDALVDAHLLPFSQLQRFPFGELCFHGEFGAGQIQRALQVKRFGHGFGWLRLSKPAAFMSARREELLCYNEYEGKSAAGRETSFLGVSNLIK